MNTLGSRLRYHSNLGDVGEIEYGMLERNFAAGSVLMSEY